MFLASVMKLKAIVLDDGNDQYPLTLFDTLGNISDTSEHDWNQFPLFCSSYYRNALAFLKSYNGNQATFNAFRCKVERLLHRSWYIANKSVCALRRADAQWRPFVVTLCNRHFAKDHNPTSSITRYHKQI